MFHLHWLKNAARRAGHVLLWSPFQRRHVNNTRRRRIDPAKRRIESDAHIIVIGLNPAFLELVVEVEEISKASRFWSRLCSPLVLGGIAGFFIFISSLTDGKGPIAITPEEMAHTRYVLFLPPESAYRNVKTSGGGGGGGGMREKTPAAHGKSPDITLQQLAPPTNRPPKLDPEIPAPPTLEGAIEAAAIPPPISSEFFGDPAASPLNPPPSQGPGDNVGIGDGHGSGIGAGDGAGYGEGRDGGAGGGRGGGIGDDIGKGLSDLWADPRATPLPPPDTVNVKLHQQLVKIGKRTILLHLFVTPEGNVSDVQFLPFENILGTGDTELDGILKAHIKKTWTVLAYRRRFEPDGAESREYATEPVWVKMKFENRPY